MDHGKLTQYAQPQNNFSKTSLTLFRLNKVIAITKANACKEIL